MRCIELGSKNVGAYRGAARKAASGDFARLLADAETVIRLVTAGA